MELYKKPLRFPFLFLPIIVIKNALRNLDPIELIKFSQISKRCHKIIKYSTQKNPFKLTLGFCWSPRITINTGQNSYNMVASFFPQNYNSYMDKYGSLRIFWGAKWTEYILDALNCKINHFDITSNACFHSFPVIIDWFSTMKHCLDSVLFEGSAIISEHLKLFLEACETTKELTLLLEQQYEIAPFEFNSLQMDYIHIYGPTYALNWISMNHIMQFDCVDLILGEFAFTEQEMNLFLKEFLKGRILPRMKNFWIELLPMNFQLLTDGIEANQRERTVVREYIHRYPMLSITFRGGTDVRKESGELVTFKQSPPPNPFNPNCKARFRMILTTDASISSTSIPSINFSCSKWGTIIMKLLILALEPFIQDFKKRFRLSTVHMYPLFMSIRTQSNVETSSKGTCLKATKGSLRTGIPRVLGMSSMMTGEEPFNRLVLSSLSKRIKLLIRYSIRRNKFKLHCHFTFFPKIILVCGLQKLTKELEHGIRSFKNADGTLSLHPFSDDFIEEMKSYTDILSEKFNCIIHHLHIDSSYCLGRFKSIYDWVNSKQPSIESCRLDGYRVLNGEITDFIQNCKVTRRFYFYIITRAMGPIYPRFVADFVYLEKCGEIPYVTLNDVSQFDCIEIIMGDFRVFSSRGINTFLKNWIRLPMSRLGCFVIYVPYFKPESLFEGIHFEKREESFVRYYKSQFYGNLKLEGGNDIKNENGKSATIHQESKHFVDEEGQIYTRDVFQFRMIVWN